MTHDWMCQKNGLPGDPPPAWGDEPPVRPCDCIRFHDVRTDERATYVLALAADLHARAEALTDAHDDEVIAATYLLVAHEITAGVMPRPTP